MFAFPQCVLTTGELVVFYHGLFKDINTPNWEQATVMA